MRYKITELIAKGFEGRRLEFKRELPQKDQIIKTAIAFCNTVGGTIFIGIENETKKVIGIPESDIFAMEEKVSQIIFDNCYPAILPEVGIYNIEDKLILVITIYPGSNLPYYHRVKGKQAGVYIRVGSSNKLADENKIIELEYKKRNISYDSLPIYDYSENLPKLNSFIEFYKQNTNRSISESDLVSLELMKKERKRLFPTNTYLLFCDYEYRKTHFPFAQIECARFKGTTPSEFLDQFTCQSPIFLQPDEAMNFVKRNIAKGSVIKGTYREDRWEYPLIAIREAIINAVVHRDYSILGSDIKLAIFDDMIEITSPGGLMPSFDIYDLGNNPSEIRNRTIAPVFKDCGLIEKWGSGFKKIIEELRNYPELEMKINEPANSFQIQFVKNDYLNNVKATDKTTVESAVETTVETTVENLTGTEKMIYDEFARNPNLTLKEISGLINKSIRATEKASSNLVKNGYLERIGSTKKGYWKVKKKLR